MGGEGDRGTEGGENGNRANGKMRKLHLSRVHSAESLKSQVSNPVIPFFKHRQAREEWSGAGGGCVPAQVW